VFGPASNIVSYPARTGSNATGCMLLPCVSLGPMVVLGTGLILAARLQSMHLEGEFCDLVPVHAAVPRHSYRWGAPQQPPLTHSLVHSDALGSRPLVGPPPLSKQGTASD
jgi:hypothetical protein